MKVDDAGYDLYYLILYAAPPTAVLKISVLIFLPLHSDEGLTSEMSVSDTPDFHGVQLSLQFPFVSKICCVVA